MQKLFQNFIKCGILGWCLEISFTALQSLRRRDFTLRGVTSLWMFPIYGAGCLLAPVFRAARRLNWAARGFLYACLILTGEYLSGYLLRKKDLCPWDYGKARWNLNRVIRLDYIPCWAATGLLMERATRDAGSVPRH
ncbi:MAG TPA: putative ABC transporter permease [Candidatus Eisenbergiella merdipullorum]|uniref:ABC transporter permease n=1 Tax=Candidatus Eisenbergiella merdipullorum TaxID=2838553 RepID=A0A9D2I6W5_9FIRM|nr:putative ABC transporter permease [Candidatus Eisenbergiella merdipullorum]